MAAKHSSANESPDKVGFTTELERDDEDNLLRDDYMNSQPLTTIPVASAKANDTLESTLLKIIDNMLAVCQSMSSVQETLARFADGQRPSKRQRVDEMSDSDIDSNNDASDFDSDTLLKKGEKSSPTRESKDDLLDTIANDLNADEQTDQDVSDKLAKLVNKRWSEKLTSDKLTEKLKKHSRPGNLGSLVAPRVNPEIWANMGHTARRVDLRASNTQNILAKVGTIIAKCTDNLLKAREKDAKKIDLDEMVSFHTDALALLGHSQYELSLKRREAIKPSLKKEYAALCSPNVPVTSLLYGDDLQQQLNNIKASNKISQVSANVNKSHKAGYKGSYSDSGKHRPSDQYYKRSFHSHSRWKNRGEKSKNFKSLLYKKKEGGNN